LNYAISATFCWQTSHFTRAAETLTSLSPLSQQIKQLEAELGTTLFDRIGKRVMLTGEILRAHARVLVELEQAQIAVQELEGIATRKLTVGMYTKPDLAACFVTQLFHFTSSCLPMKLSLVLKGRCI